MSGKEPKVEAIVAGLSRGSTLAANLISIEQNVAVVQLFVNLYVGNSLEVGYFKITMYENDYDLERIQTLSTSKNLN